MRRYCVLGCGGLAAAIAMCASLPARAELVVTISKADQRMSVVVDGSEAHRWPVSTGRGRYQTPSGQFRPTRFERSWYSRKYDNAPMPFSIFFYKGYAVHGTTEVKHLGRAASHGCVRLHPDNAAVLFSLARAQGPRATRIVVTGLRLDGSSTEPAHRAPRHHERYERRYRGREPDAQRDPTPPGRGFEAFGKAMPDTPPPRAATRTDPAPVERAPVARAADDVTRPGVHVVTMKVGNEAELRAVYRKYGFRW